LIPHTYDDFEEEAAFLEEQEALSELEVQFEQLEQEVQPLTDEQMLEFTPEGVTLVRSKEAAKPVVEKLLELKDRYDLCGDVEVIFTRLWRNVCNDENQGFQLSYSYSFLKLSCDRYRDAHDRFEKAHSCGQRSCHLCFYLLWRVYVHIPLIMICYLTLCRC
jgi:hypothetical protein